MSRIHAEVIGHPIAHSKSPRIHAFWLGKLGLEGEYAATDVAPDALAAFFLARRQDPDWRGCNVTVPHKQAVIASLDELTPLARDVRAVNTVHPVPTGLVGTNTDVAGIISALPPRSGAGLREACLIGSGGAALAALAAFRQLGVSKVHLNVRDPAKGEGLLAGSGLSGRVGAIDDEESFASAQLILNATTLGMTGQAPMPQSLLDRLGALAGEGTIVFDMVYAPLETELLRTARKHGLDAVDGLAMLIGQAAEAFEIFFGRAAPRQHDAELRAMLTS